MDNKEETTASKVETTASISGEGGKLPARNDNLASLPHKRGVIKKQILSSIFKDKFSEGSSSEPS
jgi:hypothetical protein